MPVLQVPQTMSFQLKHALSVVNLGRMGYKQALEIQMNCAKIHLDSFKDATQPLGKNTLFLVEHNPVYTIGTRTAQYSIEDEEKLKNLGAEYCKTNRGGLITFHGPGQLVAYPVINLKHFNLGIREYVCKLERTILRLCKIYGISAATTEDIGVWVGDEKLCAIGVHCSRYITYHGLALNCNNDLAWFDHIVPCGLEGKGVTSMSALLNRNVTIEEVTEPFLRTFSEEFECQLETTKLHNKVGH